MYIKSLVVDGFKSYGTRTEIVGFDQRFNAITGLNGSGKSNILDAICFVLGLSNMSLARCTTLRELIYKNGQAGVSKAVVTMTLDNSDTENSPTGYEHHKEIVIRREVHLNSRTKYYVCGQTVSNQQVSDLFHSVHLNISNPHFLIMQGRITKVLNMKPPETLSMLEEATGVSMYELKKKSTQNIIEKKDQTVSYIKSLGDETIKPKLEELRKEEANLLDFRNLESELEKLSKQETAWHFEMNKRKADKVAHKLEKCKEKLRQQQESIEERRKYGSELVEQIEEGMRTSDELSGGKIMKIEKDLTENEKVELKESNLLDKESDAFQHFKKELDDLNKQASKEEQLKIKNTQKHEKLEADFKKLEEESKNAQENLERATKNHDAITAGAVMNDDGEAAGSMEQQLIKAEEDYNRAVTDSKIAKTQHATIEQQFKVKKADASKFKAEFDKDNKHIDQLRSEVDSVREQAKKTGFDSSVYDKLEDERMHLKRDYNDLKAQVKSEESNHFSQLNFEYTNPSPNFNRSAVKGLVCKLFSVKEPKYARAIEAAAGGRLYYVVADNQDTCREILDRGNLRRRHNFIALNKVNSRTADKRTTDAARKLANDSDIHAAIDMVEFDEYLRPAMEFVFGDTMIAPTVDKAMKITYSHLKKRTVTFDGDNIMPGGDMTGGAAPKQESFLVKLVSLKEKYSRIQKIEYRLDQIQRELDAMEGPRRACASLEAELKHREMKLQVVVERLKQTSSHHQLLDEVAAMEIELKNLKEKIDNCDALAKKSSAKMKELKAQLANQEQSRKEQLAKAKKALSTAQEDANSKQKLLQEQKRKYDALRLEIEDLEKNHDQNSAKIKNLTESLEEKQAALEKQKKVHNHAKEKVLNCRAALKEEKQRLRQQNEAVNKLVKERDQIESDIHQKELEIKKIEHEMEQIESEGKAAAQTVKAMLKKHDWINEERHLFGQENSDYPFHRKDFDINAIASRNQKLRANVTALSKTVNPRASMLLADKEKEFEDLVKKQAIIREDRDKLIAYMDEVDRKKKEALHEAWMKVNVDFDSIFSTFLPNTHAKLDLIPGKDLLDGLEVRIAFGDVWKESLTELSGGQRSLVALSLILALLKYNPAPLYILDEVDAALDQNHTQNTGTMIKKHFSNSQFVIVSLKDDMFRNANVLFKTKFVDGKSTVTRYTHGSGGR